MITGAAPRPAPAAPLIRTAQAARPAGDRPGAAVAELPDVKKIGRNDACPCGSGKKYKKCCGK
ncbi:MAG: SEC-C domain-containing protein [Elusimicrobia bacterium]|nr:SEC-C domain-containing protein [Elusimicrobiota bacterium]